jgi:hypothetical protein
VTLSGQTGDFQITQMNSDALFGLALGLEAPWQITALSFKADDDAQRRELHLQIGFVSGGKFKDEAGVDCAVHDTCAAPVAPGS